MIFNTDILNWPLELIDGLSNKWLRVFLIPLAIIVWVIPILLVFVTPVLMWDAYRGE